MDAPSYVFLSYKHGEVSTRYARELYQHFSAYAAGLNFSLYLDDVDNVAGCEWARTVDAALARCTHLLVLLTNAYWLSPQCQREMRAALARFEATQSPRLLFILGEQLRPDLFKFDASRKTGTLEPAESPLQSVSDIHFLGPFDASTRLVRLSADAVQRSDQYAQLLDRFEATLKVARG